MTVKILDKHIEIDKDVAGGKPRIKSRRITVQNIAVWHERLGKSVDEICGEHNLSLADVYAALAYYFDNREEINKSIEADEEFVKQLKQQSPSTLQSRLQAMAT